MSYHPLAMTFSLLHNQFYSLSYMKQDCQGISFLCASPSGKKNMCHVPNPPTGEEDATMVLTIRATSPMNM